MKKKNSAQTPLNKQGFWEKLSLGFLKYWPVTLLLVWLAGLCFGIHIYTQAIARDGFPDYQYAHRLGDGHLFQRRRPRRRPKSS